MITTIYEVVKVFFFYILNKKIFPTHAKIKIKIKKQIKNEKFNINIKK